MNYLIIIDLLGVLPIPLILILCGYYWMKYPPEEITPGYGYRTRMSKKNSMTWKFAHQYISKIWFWVGIALLFSSIIVLLCFSFADSSIQGTVEITILVLQLVGLCIPIISTERALKKNFDKNGIPK